MKYLFYFFLIVTTYDSLSNAQNFWQNMGLTEKGVYGLTVDSTGIIYAATSDSGVYLSTDNGNYWQQSNMGLTSLNVWSIKATTNPSGYIFAGTMNMGLFYSIDSGVTWTHTGLSEWVSEIASNSNGDIFTSTITDGIYRSTDTGNTWEKVSGSEVGSDVYSINVNHYDDVFAGTDAHIFRSTDDGDTWINIDTGLVVTGVIWSIEFNSFGDVFAGDGAGFFVGPGSVYRSLNNGNSWSQTLITNRSVIALTIIPASTVCAATDSGVYVSYNNGETGEQINSGLTESLVYSLTLDKAGYLFAGTNNGIFRSIELITAIDERKVNTPSYFVIKQNYPNPFNPSTTITYQIPELNLVTIKVYDILGKEVVTLVDEEKIAGEYEIEFDGSSLTSGIYFYQLQVMDFIETKKMVLMK